MRSVARPGAAVRRGLGAAFGPTLALLAVAHAAAAPGEFDCLIEPDRVVEVSGQAQGTLETVAVDRGDRVEAGQVIATLESAVERAAVEVARARAGMTSALRSAEQRLAFQRRKLARSEELHQKKAISSTELDEVKTDVGLAELAVLEAEEGRRMAELELERALANLRLRTIRSPIAGVVMERFRSPGELLSGEPVVMLARLDPLRVEVILPVAVLGQVAIGMRAEVRPEAPVSGTYEAEVTVVDPVVDSASGTFGVRLMLPNPDYRLHGGLKCTIRFPEA